MESTKDWIRFALLFVPLTILAITTANKLFKLYVKVQILDPYKKDLREEVDKQIAEARRDFESNTGEARVNAFNALKKTEDHEKRISDMEVKIDPFWDMLRKGAAKVLLQSMDRED